MAKFWRTLQNLGSRIKRGLGHSIATRLSVSLLAIIALSGLLFTIVGVTTISKLIVAEAEERVRNDLSAARLIYSYKLDQIRQAAEFTASRTFIEDILLQKASAQGYVSEIIQFKVNNGLDVLTFIDSQGIVVLRASNPEYRGDDQSRQALVSAVLAVRAPAAGTIIVSSKDLQNESPALVGQAYFLFIDTPMARIRPESEETSGMMLAAAVPVFNDNGEFIGIVYAGVLLNRNYEIVDKVKQTVFQDVVYEGRDIGTATIFQDDVRISTNVHNEDGSRAIGTRIAADVYEQVVVNGKQWVGRAFVVNDWYIAAYEPIKNNQGKIIGILYVGILEQKYTDIGNRSALIFSSITLTGVILSLFFVLLISRGISSSIKRLVVASKQLSPTTNLASWRKHLTLWQPRLKIGTKS
jgi:two-component system NtrC family sensor kinase